MNKKSLLSLLSILIILLVIVSCEKDYKDEPTVPVPPVVSKSFVEEFDTASSLSRKGWVIINKSYPLGGSAWRQGKYELGGKFGNEIVGFPAYSATLSPNDFLSADLGASDNAGEISCWLITPPMPAKNGDVFSFYTRSTGNYPERLQVRGNYTNQSAYVGDDVKATGDFPVLLVDIDPNYSGLYPIGWTKYTITFSDLPAGTSNIRLAFRYMVDDTGVNGEMIGIDKVEFISK
ncbi:MAG: choice-of-anchor J domain-containing protein [Chitinophagaceae bacterium]|nr:choice-of-anchor J domain-containing protein [Chitinophagaceae bacterium]